jgi:hypothetical protein
MMKNLSNRVAGRLARLWIGMAVGLAVLLAPAARADDTVHLKNGQAVTGEIVREEGGFLWIKTVVNGIEETKLFAETDIDRIERDAPATDPAPGPATDPAPGDEAAAQPEAAEEEEEAIADTGAERVAIITLGEGGDKDMVGLYMTAKALQDAIPLLERDKVDTVVFRINSGGGLGLEVQRLSDVIQNEYKPRFRVVAWIESAISAAAMTAHCIEEIYFAPEGNYGACTGFRSGGSWVAIADRELEDMLFEMEKISARGKHDDKIMRSMQIMEPLSCDIDPDGTVRWYQNEQGQHLVNPKGRILTFNSQTAEKFKFSQGTARTIDELADAMGLPEVHWVGVKKPGYAWPISKAEQAQIDYRNKVNKDEKQLKEYWQAYNANIAAAEAEPEKEDRGQWVGKARAALNKIKSMVKNNPNFALLTFNMLPSEWNDWLADQDQRLRDLMR